ncbi:MAG: HAD family phosphatase [Phycisphaeraceae bacterium]|nr:HAD family phosphatase [Phycisphaeraceae bacterium]
MSIIKPHHKALIFDCDGTLVDSMPLHWIAWEKTARKYGLEAHFPFDRFMAWGGRPATAILEQLTREAGITLDTEAVALEKEASYVDLIDQLQPIEPVLAIARHFRGKLPMAVATGAHRAVVLRSLGSAGITDWFDAIVTCEDVTHPKPHPETYLKAAEALGMAPSACLAFEDAEPGFVAAREAGMEVIDVRDLLGQTSA